MSQSNSDDPGSKATQNLELLPTTQHGSEETKKKNDSDEDFSQESCYKTSVVENSARAKESATTQPSDELLYPVHPKFSTKSARLRSYEGWPEHKRQKPEDLAEAGLFYIGEDDKTMCYYCGGGLKDWEEVDDPWQQHEMWFSSECDYVRLRNR